MSTPSPFVEQQWFTGRPSDSVIAITDDGAFVLLSEDAPDLPLTILRAQGKTVVCASAEFVSELGLGSTSSEADIVSALERSDRSLHGADNLFYVSVEERPRLLAEQDAVGVRVLTDADTDAFAAFTAECSEQDLDDAYVELDHHTVVGAFVGGRLVCAASTYPWGPIDAFADTGVLTDPAFRGQGFARAVVRAIFRRAFADGREPQYRCQLDNTASVALARSAGLSLFGTWDIVTGDDEE